MAGRLDGGQGLVAGLSGGGPVGWRAGSGGWQGGGVGSWLGGLRGMDLP